MYTQHASQKQFCSLPVLLCYWSPLTRYVDPCTNWAANIHYFGSSSVSNRWVEIVYHFCGILSALHNTNPIQSLYHTM